MRGDIAKLPESSFLLLIAHSTFCKQVIYPAGELWKSGLVVMVPLFFIIFKFKERAIP